jgi:hypothetical protein
MGMKNMHIPRDIIDEDLVSPASVSKYVSGRGKIGK